MILSGILMVGGGRAEVIQYFADSPDDEKQIIEKTLEALRQVDFILTYNGQAL